MTLNLAKPASDPRLWPLDSGITFLNHGSFGSCPLAVLDFQQQNRARLESQPVQFLVRELEPLWDKVRASVAKFLKAEAEDMVFVSNATAGINTVLRSLTFKHGDELLVTDHEYNSSRTTLDFVAERSGARVVVARVPFPVQSPDEIVDAIMGKVTARTRLALLDHVTSQTGLIFPIEHLVREMSNRGIETLVDGAHAPGMVPVDLKKLGATYYTGNCHKWLCGPKTAAFLYVKRDRQRDIRPLIISHGANSKRLERSRFLLEFAWMGTGDPSACLSVAKAMRFIGSQMPGGWPAVMRRNHELAVAGRKVICGALEIPEPCPQVMIGSMASIPIPDAPARPKARPPWFLDPLQEKLWRSYRIEVPVIPWPKSPKRLLRISAQLYNSLPEYERLAAVLKKTLR